MKTALKAAGVVVGLVTVPWMFLNQIAAQTVLEAPAFSDPSLLAAIFVPSKPDRALDEPVTAPSSEFKEMRHEFRRTPQKASIPRNWEVFDKQFAPEQHSGKPVLQLLENGLYQANQVLYSVKLLERNVNTLLSFEWSLRELSGYDSRTEANAPDNFFDHAKVKTEFEWDAPIGLYVGLRFQIKCDSIFQFWK